MKTSSMVLNSHTTEMPYGWEVNRRPRAAQTFVICPPMGERNWHLKM